MKILKTLTVTLCILVWVGIGLNPTLLAQDKMPTPEEMQKIWQENMTPGAQHKYLENFVGQWNAVITTWLQPGAEPMVANCEVDAQMILGGRYLYFTMKGTMMGMPFEGININGYNNYKKEFFTLWLDNQSTAFVDSYGSLDEAGKVRTENGLWDDPITRTKMKVKTIDTMVDKDKHVYDMIVMLPNGTEFKSMTIVYTRKK